MVSQGDSELIQRAKDMSDMARSEGADDVAHVLDELITEITALCDSLTAAAAQERPRMEGLAWIRSAWEAIAPFVPAGNREYAQGLFDEGMKALADAPATKSDRCEWHDEGEPCIYKADHDGDCSFHWAGCACADDIDEMCTPCAQMGAHSKQCVRHAETFAAGAEGAP